MVKKRKNNKKSNASNDIMKSLFLNTSSVIATSELNLPNKPTSYRSTDNSGRSSERGHWRDSSSGNTTSFETWSKANEHTYNNGRGRDRYSSERSYGDTKPDRYSSRGGSFEESRSDNQSSWGRSSGDTKPDRYSSRDGSFGESRSDNQSSWGRSSGDTEPDRYSSRGDSFGESRSDNQSSWERSSGDTKPDTHSYEESENSLNNPKPSFWSEQNNNESTWRRGSDLK